MKGEEAGSKDCLVQGLGAEGNEGNAFVFEVWLSCRKGAPG